MTRGGRTYLASSGKRWTREEDDILRQAAPTLRYRQMAGILPGRTLKAVRARLIKLGLYQATARNRGTYTVPEVSRILGVCEGTVRDWVRYGKLRCERVPSLKVQVGRGGRIVITDADLDAFITEYPFLFSLASFPEGPHKGTLIMARPQDWLTRGQAARSLGICVHHLDWLARQGKIPFRQFGRPRFFHRRDIEHYRDHRAHRLAVSPGYRNVWLQNHGPRAVRKEASA